MKSKENQLITGRRDMLKMLGFGSAALFMGEIGMIPSVDMFENPEISTAKKPSLANGRSSVALANGTDRRAMMYEVSKPFEEQIRKGIKGKQLIIKPNMVSVDKPLCATHVDAIRGFLEFMKPIYKGQIIIAEASGSTSDSTVGFKNYGYMDLQKEFDIKFVDLNAGAGSPMWILDQNLYPDKIQIADIFSNPNNYIVSISRLKTHNAVTMTAATKNITMGAPIKGPVVNGIEPTNYKRRMHAGGSRWLHYNMFQLAKQVRPDFSVIDGVEGMQGNGPNSGFPADSKIALAGQDFVAVDSLCAKLMGIPLENVGYLNYCAADGIGVIDYDKIDILGGIDPDKYVIPYKMHDNIETQLEWKKPLTPPQK
jgi:uncharacterized protein (DUF362 family)